MGKIEIDHTGSGGGITLSSDGTDLLLDGSAISGGGGGGIASVVADTTPQLGGNLDTNNKNIVFGDSSGTAVNRLKFGAGSDLEIYHNTSNSIIQTTNTHSFKLMGGSDNYIVATPANAVTLYHNGSPKIATSSTGISVTGTVAATALTGNGSGLTSLPAQAFSAITSKPTTISGYGITDAATEFGLPADQSFTVVNSGSGSYTIGGGASGSNAALTLIRGRTYKFAVNATGHPFYINTSNTTGTGAAYVNGTAVINNGAAVGDIYFTVPDTAPATLYYNCQYHSSMAGTINISSALVVDKANDKVGIGTTAPGAKLTITDEDSGQAMLQVRNYSAAATGSFGNAHSVELRSATSTTTHGVLINHNENNIGRRSLDVGDSTGIFASFVQGKVGIGTTAPSVKLHVAGATSGDYLAKIESTNTFGLKIKTTSTSDSHEQLAIHDGSNNVQFKVMGGGTVHATGINLGGSGAANRLDDYEEGEWTPGWVGTSGGSWTSRTGYTKGYYTKIGRLVTVTVRFETISRGSPSGYLQMTGLPFTNLNYTANVANQVYKVILLRGNTAVTDSIGVFARLTGNASSVQFYTRRTNSAYSFDQLPVGSVTGNFEGGFEFSYVTS